jgi:Flp pilus assembly protein TadD
MSDAAYWSWRAYIQGRAGQLTEANRAIHELLEIEKSKPVDPTAMAQVFCGTGDKDRALGWLGKAYAQRSSGLTSLKVNPTYDALRGDARFRNLLLRVGLEQ